MNKKELFLAFGLTVFGIASLAQTTDPVPANHIAIPSCCKQYTELVKTPLPDALTEIKLDETFPRYDFGNGLQTYLFLELPEFKKPYHVNINNIPQAPGFFNKTTYSQIAMRIETFDSALNSKRVYKHTSMKKRGLGFDKTVFINPSNESEKYLLIYGDLNAAPEETVISEKSVTMTGATSGLALSLLVAVASGGRVFLANPVVNDGTDHKVEIATNDKGIIVVDAKGLTAEK